MEVMDCCQIETIDSHFHHQKADKKLAEFRKKGSQKTTRILVDALIAQGIKGATLLDIGGGIGAIQHELLNAGASRATNLEASSAYIDACRKEAERQGHGDRITHVHGDFTDMESAPMADIVTLERVICCYPDMPGLVSQSCAKTGRLLGLVFPHEAWWVKMGLKFFYNLRFKVTGDPFRVYLHPTSQIEKVIENNGLLRLFYQISGQWQVAIYERTG